MLPARWPSRTGAMKRSSAIWISAAPSVGSRADHCDPVSTCPPLTATISPAAMGTRAKRPWPWIGLGRTSVGGERYVRSAMGGHGGQRGQAIGHDGSELRSPWGPHPALSPEGRGWEGEARLLEDREVDLFLGDELEQDRDALAGLGDAALDRVDDLARLGDALAVAAEGLRHVRVVAADVGGAVLLGGGLHDRQLDAHREVVEQDRQDRDALARRGLAVSASENDGRVAPHVDAERFRLRELGPHREAEAVAELGGLAPADVGERVRG